MKKLLILVLIVLLLSLAVYIGIEGLKIYNVEILGIYGIQEKNMELEKKISVATKLVSTDYKKAVSTVDDNAKKLEQEKQKYDEMVAISTESDVQEAAQFPTYEIEYLWTKIGNHATSEGATIKMEVTKGTNTTQNTYNLNFIVNGTYISITDFISDIENDSSLGFKIEEFHMLPKSGEELQATFSCKDIIIKDLSQAVITTNKSEEQENSDNNEEDKKDKKDNNNESSR